MLYFIDNNNNKDDEALNIMNIFLQKIVFVYLSKLKAYSVNILL